MIQDLDFLYIIRWALISFLLSIFLGVLFLYIWCLAYYLIFIALIVCEKQGAGGRSCVNTCSDGFRSIQGSYLAPADVLDANNQITIKFLKV